MDYEVGESVARITAYELGGWEYINKMGLLFSSGPKRAHLVTFKNPCRTLDPESTLVFKSLVGGLSRGDEVGVNNGVYREDRCYVDNIFVVDKLPS